MANYILKQPEKKSQPAGYWFFVGILSTFLLWIVLIRPMMLPADQMPFIFVYDETTKQVTDPVAQKLTYFFLTSGAIITALLLLIPSIRESSRFEYTLALLWVNRDYVMHEEYMSLADKLKSGIWRGNSLQIQKELQDTVNKHKGKDLRVVQYNIKEEFAEDLELEK